MWYISIFFYLYGVASLVTPNMTDITGNWVPTNNSMLSLECNVGQMCGNNTMTTRSSFHLLSDATWVKKVLVGTGNCTDSQSTEGVIFVVESYGAYLVDLDGLDNDTNIPIVFSPEPQTVPQTVPTPEPQPIVSPQTVPAPAPDLSPAELNPSPFIIQPAPQPQVNPAPQTGQAPESNLSPAELNPSPFIIIPVSDPNNLDPIPGTWPEPSPSPMMTPEPASQPAGNFSVWLHIISVPMKFHVSIIDDDELIPYTETPNGPCKPVLEYWRDATLGCPCNGNWIGDGTYNESMTVGGREIVPDDCTGSTGTTCPEAFYINDTQLYGNARLNVTVYENGTIMNKTLEITKMSSYKEIGYTFGVADIIAVYKLADNTPINQTPGSPAPAEMPTEGPDDGSGSGSSTIPLATTITTIFVFLLSLYEYTQ
jgi:hypothetical protein